MRICIVSDAWEPQVNGVVRTLKMTRATLERRGHTVDVIGPDRFRSTPCPSYPEIRLALAGKTSVGRHIEAFRPNALHIATEGPLGYAARRWAKRHGLPFTTAFHTHFPEYVARRTGLSADVIWPVMRRFHSASNAVLCATNSLTEELVRRGITHTRKWSRGVDLEAFGPEGPLDDRMVAMAGLRPRLLYVGRVAVEKNLEAFLSLETGAAKFIVGDGPVRPELDQKYPTAHFLGVQKGEALAAAYRTADAFVFPSRTDTFGLVMIEALASGTPVAAYDVMGPRDILTRKTGAMHEDLGVAVSRALRLRRLDCVAHSARFTWDNATDQFEDALVPFGKARWRESAAFA